MNSSIQTIALCVLMLSAVASCKKATVQDPAEQSPSAMGAAKTNSNSSTTEQSIMIALDQPDPVIKLSGSETYQFNREAAASYFVGGTQNQREQVAQSQRCTFWSGGTLVSQTLGGGPNEVTIQPISAAISASHGDGDNFVWKLKTATGSSQATVSLNFIIAAESAVKSKQGTKYSFSLSNRISDLRLEVIDGSGNTVYSDDIVNDPSYPENNEYEVVAGNAPYKYDGDIPVLTSSILYTGNAGVFPALASTLLLNGSTIGDIIKQNAYGDNTVTANNTEIVKLTHPRELELGLGTYQIKVSGKLKDNSGSLTSSSFQVTGGNFAVHAENCAN